MGLDTVKLGELLWAVLLVAQESGSPFAFRKLTAHQPMGWHGFGHFRF